MGQNELEQGFTLKRVTGLGAILALGCALVTAVSPGTCPAQDDWEAVSSSGASQPSASGVAQPSAGPVQQPEQPSPARNEPSSDAAKPLTVCGERVTAASPRVKSMVDQINGLWGTNFPVYQTVAFEQPHASPGGCVFYNPAAMATILTYRLDVNDKEIVDPLVWAIFAHEIGHQIHQDNEKSRRWVPIETKELEADRFAGYTLEKLQIRAADLTPFWNMTGDEFGGPVTARNQHGLSSQRVAAFKQGWHLAEWNRAENSQSVAEAEEESVAPDSPDLAPK